MSKLAIDYNRTTTAPMVPGQATNGEPFNAVVRLWEAPPPGITYEGAIEMMHERTLELAKMLETIIDVLPELPVVSLPKGQQPGSDGFKL